MTNCLNTQQQMTNKEASNLQESMVAKYLGWNTVVGSGARPFRPGDVQNEHYLIECKTHTSEQQNIIFYTKHWDKISKEARSINKYPALVVDNGTQKSHNTWVMVPKRVLPEKVFKIFGLVNTAKSDSTITFRHESAKSLYKSGYNDEKISYFPGWCNQEQVAIMSLSEFKKFYEEEFEC